MNKTLKNYIEEICSTKMPDNDYPAFSLFKSQDAVQAQLSWQGIEVIGEIPSGVYVTEKAKITWE